MCEGSEEIRGRLSENEYQIGPTLGFSGLEIDSVGGMQINFGSKKKWMGRSGFWSSTTRYFRGSACDFEQGE